MTNNYGFSDMKDKEENKFNQKISWYDESEAHELPEHNCLQANFDIPNPKVFFDQDATKLVLVSYDAFEITYCPFCGRHAEEIALEFVDDKDLEVAQNGS